jgi:hypothetical protein
MDVVRGLYQRHLRRIGRHGQVLWAILVLAAWAERWVGRGAAVTRQELLVASDTGVR